MPSASFYMEGLTNLTDRVRDLVSADFRVELAQVLSVAALAEVNNGFRNSTNPYGDAWRPLAYRNGQPLLHTGRMRASTFVAQVGPDGFTIRIGAGYAVYHQEGARVRKPKAGRRSRGRVGSLPRRMMVPSTETGLGPVWSLTFKRDATALVKGRLSRGVA